MSAPAQPCPQQQLNGMAGRQRDQEAGQRASGHVRRAATGGRQAVSARRAGRAARAGPGWPRSRPPRRPRPGSDGWPPAGCPRGTCPPRAGTGTAEEHDGRLVQVRQRRPGHAGQHGHPGRRLGQRGKRAHHRQAGEAVTDGYPHEDALVVAPFAPVRRRVKREVRRHAQGEGDRRTACDRAYERAGQDVVGDEHGYRRARRTSVPTQARSGSGTTTEPSGCWFCSTIAGSSRLVARPDALRVWT